MSYPPAPPSHGYPPGPQPAQPGSHGAPPPQPPYGQPYPPGGWAPPGPARSSNMGWVIALVAVLVLAIGAVLALWLGGVFDRERSSSASSGSVDINVATPASARAPCEAVVRAGDPGSSTTGRIFNRLTVGSAGVLWNSAPIDPVTLRQYLDVTRTMRPIPVLVTEVEPGANPAIVQRVRVVIGQSLGCEPASL